MQTNATVKMTKGLGVKDITKSRGAAKTREG
jgi:hypothetical protein